MATQTGSISFEATGGFSSYASGQYATDERMRAAETAIEQTADNVLIKATKTDTTDAQGGQHLIQSLINVAPQGVKIAADKVNITGDVVFSAINNDTGTTKISGGKVDVTSIRIGQSQVTDLTDDLADAKKHTQVIVSATNVNYVADTCTLTARFYVDGVLQTSSSLKWQWYRDGTAQGSQQTDSTGTLSVTSALGVAHRYACKCTF